MPNEASPSGVHVVVIAKQPVPGKVKTRLTPPCSPAAAAQLASAALGDTLDAVADTPLARRTVALDGRPGPWLPDGFAVVAQRGAGLDERLGAALEDAQRTHAAPVLLIGMDTPQVTPALLTACCRALLTDGTDAVLGLADDGGWWALGLRRADGALLRGVPTSSSATGRLQLRRLHEAGLGVELLPTLTDVDDALTATRVARIAPRSRFAAGWRAIATAS